MFEKTLLESSSGRIPGGRRLTVPLAIVLESVFIGVLMAVPLLNIAALPKMERGISDRIFSPPVPPSSSTTSAASKAVHRVTLADLTHLPVRIPSFVSRSAESPAEVALTALTSGPGGIPGGIGASGIGMSDASVPVPPPPEAATKSKPIRVDGGVEEAKLIYGPKPAYPQLAIMAHVQGRVRLQATIAKDGSIRDLRVMSGHPQLVRAAIEAVSQWRYQPTLLNGDPVEVEIEIDVKFTLNQ